MLLVFWLLAFPFIWIALYSSDQAALKKREALIEESRNARSGGLERSTPRTVHNISVHRLDHAVVEVTSSTSPLATQDGAVEGEGDLPPLVATHAALSDPAASVSELTIPPELRRDQKFVPSVEDLSPFLPFGHPPEPLKEPDQVASLDSTIPSPVDIKLIVDEDIPTDERQLEAWEV